MWLTISIVRFKLYYVNIIVKGIVYKMRTKKSFKTSLFLLFVLSIFIPLIAISILLSSYFKTVFLDETKKSFLNTLYSTSKNIQTYLDDLKRFSISPNLYDEIMEMYEFIDDGKFDNIDNLFEYFTINNQYTVSMQKILNSMRNDVIGTVFIPINQNNTNIYVTERNYPNINVIKNYDYIHKSWFKEAVDKKGAPIFSTANSVDYYRDTDSITVFSVVRLIKDIDKNKNIGVLKVDASPEAMSDLFKNITTSPNSVMMLVDQNNNVIYSTRNKYNYILMDLESDNDIVISENKKYHCYISDVENTPWKLLYLSSESDIKAKTNTIYYVTIFFGILCISISFFIFDFKSTAIVNPVQNIIDTMKEVETGNLEVEAIPYKDNYDFYMIAIELNNMIKNLNIHIENEYKAVISQKNAQYLALQTQINPHFLYNVLNGFITLNRIGDKKTLEKSILQLTTLFRYTCNNDSRATVKDELNFVKNYLSLQKLRFDERLNFNIDLNESIENFTIPKLLIQPLVENSVVHGMEPSDESILIEVYAYKYTNETIGNFVIISILDNGVGFDEKILESSSRVGLSNISERLTLFNKNSSFVIKSTPFKLTSCHIIIPY